MSSLFDIFRRKAAADADFFLDAKKRLKVPSHIAVIMDGNGRWAKKRGLPRVAGHNAGSNAVRKTIKTAANMGVKYLSIYTFSADNWKRPKDEVETLMRLIEENLEKETAELHKNNVIIKTIGRKEGLPESLINAFKNAEQLTKDNSGLVLQVALNYGGRNEIVDAVKKMLSDNTIANVLDEHLFKQYLYSPETPYPELLIRTGGDLRISDFLLWHIAYTEIWVTEKLWPDFDEYEFVKAIEGYTSRERRFGGLPEKE